MDAIPRHQNETVFDAVLFNLQIIGEAAKQLPPHATAMMDEIAWTDAARFRDFVAHHYFSIDPEIVWDIVKQRIPKVRTTARSLLNSQLEIPSTLRGPGFNRVIPAQAGIQNLELFDWVPAFAGTTAVPS